MGFQREDICRNKSAAGAFDIHVVTGAETSWGWWSKERLKSSLRQSVRDTRIHGNDHKEVPEDKANDKRISENRVLTPNSQDGPAHKIVPRIMNVSAHELRGNNSTSSSGGRKCLKSNRTIFVLDRAGVSPKSEPITCLLSGQRQKKSAIQMRDSLRQCPSGSRKFGCVIRWSAGTHNI